MLHKRSMIMKAHRLKKVDIAQKKPCPFCDMSQIAEIVTENKTIRLIRNRTPYAQFEGIHVTDHLMATPKRHVKTMSEFTDQEKIDYIDILAPYEEKDYSVYSRSLRSATRSVDHLHTHVLQLPGHRTTALLYIARPYFMIMAKRTSARNLGGHRRTQTQ